MLHVDIKQEAASHDDVADNENPPEVKIKQEIKPVENIVNTEYDYAQSTASDVKPILKENVEDSVEDNVENNVIDDIEINMEDDVKDNIKDDVEDNIKDDVEDNIKDNVEDNIKDDVEDYIKDDVEDNVENDIVENTLCLESSKTSKVNNTGDIVLIENSSLNNLLVYTSDDSSSFTDSESCDSIVLSDNEEDETQDETPKATLQKTNVQDTIRTFGELTLDDLPPVPDMSHLNIALTEADCIHVGTITGIIDRLVTVESLPDIPAYDLDTLLFLEKGNKPLGYVYDVMGPVSRPIYVIRFNSKEEWQNIGVEKGQAVFSAPKTEHTQYVFLKQLMENKGCDASWMGDNEVPPDHVDYSDDEEERKIKKSKAKKSSGGTTRNLMADNRKRNSLECYENFEKDMNVKNLIDTRLHKIRDGTLEPVVKRHAPNDSSKNKKRDGFPFPANVTVPSYGYSQFAFDTNVPSFTPFCVPFVHPTMGNFTPYVSQNVSSMVGQQPMPFSPSMPPPRLPMQNGMSPMQVVYPNFSIPPPAFPVDARQDNIRPRMMFPPDRGLPRPQSTFIPGVPFLESSAHVSNTWNFQTSTASFQGPQSYQTSTATYFQKRP